MTLDFAGLPDGHHEELCPTTYEKSFAIICGVTDFKSGVHLDDGGSSYSSSVWFQIASYVDKDISRLFTPLSVAVRSLGTAFGSCGAEPYSGYCLDTISSFNPAPFDNVLLQVFVNGRVVAQQTSSSFGDLYEIINVDFTSDFTDIQWLKITQTRPTAADMAANPFSQCQDSPCAHFDVAGLTVDSPAPIPLPAGLPLLTMGLASLMLARKRRGKSA